MFRSPRSRRIARHDARSDPHLWQCDLVAAMLKAMALLWRTWVRVALMATLLIGCNSVAPAMGVVSHATPSVEMAGCHAPSKTTSGATILVCKMSCAALPAAIEAFAPPAAMRVEFGITALPILSSEATWPESPPPRLA